MPGAVIVRYSEIGLKGENRAWFEEKLTRNIRERCHALPLTRVERRRGRVVIHHEGGAAEDRAIEEGLADTPGIRSFSRVRAVAREIGAIETAAAELAREAYERRSPRPATFRVESSRQDKSFPLKSMELDARVGGAVLDAIPGLKVKLVEPDLTIGIEVQNDLAWLMTDWRDGPGGLPVGSSGNVVLLLSGGIDSPVAGLLLQKRGCSLAPVYCHAFPFTGDAAKEKVRDLARILSRRQHALDLRVAPIGEAQVALRDRCRPAHLVVLYRRLMFRVAERIARLAKAQVLATGESIGQVASQTLPNMRAIEAATTLPVLRPLATYDKEETVKLARRLGTFETSILPADDSCQLFVPKHPSTRVQLAEIEEDEAKVDVAALVEDVMLRVEKIRFVRGQPQEG
jgi:thiamine biosynthesis protein ThiI